MEIVRSFKPYPIEAPVETGICQEMCPCCSNQTLKFVNVQVSAGIGIDVLPFRTCT